MPKVIVDRAIPAEAGDLEVQVNGPDQTFRLRPVSLPRHYTRMLAPRTRDLLGIAAAVFAADALVGRGGPTRPELGVDWSRQFRFVVPVFDAEFWSGAKDALVDLLTFLTGDHFEFEFVTRALRARAEPGLDLGPAAIRADEVVLFSGGLDSLTGAWSVLRSSDAKILLVTHQSAPKVMRAQKRLFDRVRLSYADRILWLPVLGRLVGREAVETTQRSRSFLFAALGYAAASLVGAKHIQFFENGTVSLNLPISRQVVGTMATRTTHPLALRRLGALLSLVADEDIAIRNPYAWMTKTEVVARLRDGDGARLIEATRSCSSVRARTTEHPHCGTCSQCLDRRFAILAAGVAEHDPAGQYQVELLRGPRPDAMDRTMAVDWTRHACEFSRRDEQWFRTKFAAEIATVAEADPGRPTWQIVSEMFMMHRRHGEAVRGVLEAAVRENAGPLVSQELPPTSLVILMLSYAQAEAQRPIPFAAMAEEDVQELDDETEGIHPLRVILTPGAKYPKVTIRGLGEFKGSHARLVEVLQPYHSADLSKQLELHAFQYVAAGVLANDLAVHKGTVWQYANRCRDDLIELQLNVGIDPPFDDLLIQSLRPRGYRLDPKCRFEALRSGS